MKTMLLSGLLAVGLGFTAAGSASAAPMPIQQLAAPGLTENVACRMVTKRVRRPNGSLRVTKSRVCDRSVYRGRGVYRDRRWHRGPRPGLSIRVR